MKQKKSQKYTLLLILALVVCLSLIGISFCLRPDGEHVQIRYISKTPSQAQLAVDLNHATLEELMSLPQIGETRAQSILDYRIEHGAFSSVDEIQNVPGIGPGIFQKIQAYVYV